VRRGAGQLVEVREMHHLQEIVDGILREKTPQLMLDHMHAVLLQFGIDRFVLLRFRPSGEYIDKWLFGIKTIRPKSEWLKHYQHRDDPNADPVIKRSKETVEPFFWSDVVTSRAERLRFKSPSVDEALIIPVPSPSGCVGTIFMAGPNAGRDQLHRYMLVLQAIGLSCYYHLERHRPPDPAHPPLQFTQQTLSLREGEILSLLANGMSARKSADKLNISERTVEWHIDRVMKRLGATNRIQAVVIAIRDGLIPLRGAVVV
jgi:LuxR family transcriptional regulator, quorum-sensing system regulator SolR